MRHGRVAGMKLRDGPVRRQVREQPWAALGSPGLIGCGLSKPFLRGSKEMRRGVPDGRHLGTGVPDAVVESTSAKRTDGMDITKFYGCLT